jgi:hypothetical protein
MCICLGQFILTPVKLPLDAGSEDTYQAEVAIHDKVGRTLIKRIYRVSLAGVQTINIAQSDQKWFAINNVLDAAFRVVFPHKVGPKLIDLNQRDEHGGIIVVRGVTVAATQTSVDGKMTPVVQISPAVRVVSNQTCFEGCKQILASCGTSRAKDRMAERYVKKKVCTMYGGGSGVTGMTYRVVDIDLTKQITDTFGYKKDPNMTFEGYFKMRYNINLSPSQPFFKVRPTTGHKNRAVHIPAQVLYPMELDDSQKSQLPTLCSIYPQDRMTRIMDALERLKTTLNGQALNLLESFGLSIGAEPLRIKGQVLRPIEVLVPSGGTFRPVNTGLAENQEQLGFARSLGSLNHKGTPTNYTLVHLVEPRNEGARTRAIGDIEGTLRQMSSSTVFATKKTVHFQSGGVGIAAGDLATSYDPTKTVVIASLHAKETGPYKDVKSALGASGFLSQVIAQNHTNNVVFKMIAQQINAKQGSLNWVVDITKTCPSATGKNIVIIGVDVASGNKYIETGNKLQRMDVHVVACVAFHVNTATKAWTHYCNHYVAHGKKEVMCRTDDPDAAETETTLSNESQKITSTGAVSKFLPTFVSEVRNHYQSLGLNIDSYVIARGSASDGEVAAAKRDETEAIKSAIGSTPFVHLAAQRRNNTRMHFKGKEYLPRFANDSYVNAPRGFVTTEGVPAVMGDDSITSGFYVNGANCTLGHAKQTKFNILHEGNGTVKELPELFYAMSFMFPNKPDGLPYPLPLKCADKYANLFVLLEVNEMKTLPENLRTKLHYI